MTCAILLGCEGSGPLQSPENEGPPEVVWTKDLSKDEVDNTQPLITSDGTAYVAADHRMFAFDVETGEEKWTSIPLRGDGAISGKTILEDEGRLFLNDGTVFRAFNADTGDIVWQRSIPDYRTLGGNQMAQTDQRLWIGGERELVSIQKESGRVDQRYSFGAGLPASTNHGVEDVAVRGGIAFVPTSFYRRDAPTTEGRVHALNLSTGEVRWTYEVPTKYLPRGGDDAESGERDSLLNDGAVYGLGVSEDHVIVPAGQLLIALDRETGEQKWLKTYPESGFDYGATIANGTAYVGSVGERVYAVDVESGSQRWASRSPGSITTILTVRDEKVFFCNEAGGQIWIFDAQSGETVWHSFPPGHRDDSAETYLSPLGVGPNHMVNVGSQKIYALTRPQ